jgi:HSP20 family molecular chaperone IbpA
MKISIFDRLSGATADDFDFEDDLPEATIPEAKGLRARLGGDTSSRPSHLDDEAPAAEGQLPVDVHQTAGEIVIRAFVAGVRPDELNLSIGRDMVEIEGSRMERSQVSGPDFFTRELFWGSFSRVITLPQEIDVDEATASAKDGLLTIVLPKLDKRRQTKLKVKSG